MGFIMSIKMGFSSKSFLTDITFKQLMANVGSLVSSQTTAICTLELTQVALVRFLAAVGSLVYCQVTALCTFEFT